MDTKHLDSPSVAMTSTDGDEGEIVARAQLQQQQQLKHQHPKPPQPPKRGSVQQRPRNERFSEAVIPAAPASLAQRNSILRTKEQRLERERMKIPTREGVELKHDQRLSLNWRLSNQWRRGSVLDVERKKSLSEMETKIKFEPTYRLRPKRLFSPAAAKSILDEALEISFEKLKTQFHSAYAGPMIKLLCNSLRDEMKSLEYERYRFVVTASLVERRGVVGIVSAARFLWHQNYDNYVTHSVQNDDYLLSATVFAVYKD